MKAVTYLILFSILSFMAGAQSKVDNAILKAGNTIATGQKVGDTFKNLKGLLGKKKDKKGSEAKADSIAAPIAPAATAPEKLASGMKKTVITAKGFEYGKLKQLNENIRNCAGVESSDLKFSVDGSLITITHTGTTETLFKSIGAMSKEIFTEKNIASFDEGAVTLKI